MTATQVLVERLESQPSRESTPAIVPVGVEEPRAHRDYFAACHTATPPAPYLPAYGPWRADRTLAETVAWLAYTLEGA